MTAALVAIFCLILGVVCGMLFGRATNAPLQEAQELKDSLNQVQSEFDTYKADVTQHFTKTAELVNSMTDNYRNVHTHLAGGAQTLCNGALQLESMNQKDALEAQAEAVVEETTATEEVTGAVNEAAANDDTVATTAETATKEKQPATGDAKIEASTSETEVEAIKVDANTVAAAESTQAEAKKDDKAPVELVAEAAAEQNKGENRIH
jgi:uncharacterized membrane-anchored protein YhcB (DUF1043 family)